MPQNAPQERIKETPADPENHNGGNANPTRFHWHCKRAPRRLQESTTKRLESTRRVNENHIVGRSHNSMIHWNFGTHFIPMLRAMSFFFCCESSSGQGVWKARNVSTLTNYNIKKEAILEAQRQKEKPFCCTDGHRSPREFGVGTKITEVQRTSRASRWHCERGLWDQPSLHWTGLICVPDDVENSPIWQESMTRNLSGLWADRGGNFGNKINFRTGGIGKVGCIRYLSSKNRGEGSVYQWENDDFISAMSRWNSKIVRKRQRLPSTHSKAWITCKEQWRTLWRIGRASTGIIYRWRWSPWRFLVDSRWLHSSSLHWTTSWTQCAERRNTSFPLKYTDVTRSTHTDLDVLNDCFKQTFVRLRERIYKVH